MFIKVVAVVVVMGAVVTVVEAATEVRFLSFRFVPGP